MNKQPPEENTMRHILILSLLLAAITAAQAQSWTAGPIELCESDAVAAVGNDVAMEELVIAVEAIDFESGQVIDRREFRNRSNSLLLFATTTGIFEAPLRRAPAPKRCDAPRSIVLKITAAPATAGQTSFDPYKNFKFKVVVGGSSASTGKTTVSGLAVLAPQAPEQTVFKRELAAIEPQYEISKTLFLPDGTPLRARVINVGGGSAVATLDLIHALTGKVLASRTATLPAGQASDTSVFSLGREETIEGLYRGQDSNDLVSANLPLRVRVKITPQTTMNSPSGPAPQAPAIAWSLEGYSNLAKPAELTAF